MKKSLSTRPPGVSTFDPDRFLLGLSAGLLVAFAVLFGLALLGFQICLCIGARGIEIPCSAGLAPTAPLRSVPFGGNGR
jgi:hypothetical protein